MGDFGGVGKVWGLAQLEELYKLEGIKPKLLNEI